MDHNINLMLHLSNFVFLDKSRNIRTLIRHFKTQLNIEHISRNNVVRIVPCLDNSIEYKMKVTFLISIIQLLRHA